MTQAIQPTEALATWQLPDASQVRNAIARIEEFQEIVRAQLKEDTDYGIIEGMKRPSLFKSGAEKLATLRNCVPEYDLIAGPTDIQIASGSYYRYYYRCRFMTIASGIKISEGYGSCNSYEGKYRWRNSERQCPECLKESIIKGRENYGGGWVCWRKKGGCGENFLEDDPRITSQVVGKVPNENLPELDNTIMKMAKKRSLVDAALQAGCLSDIFTQDMGEDPYDATLAPDLDAVPIESETPRRDYSQDRSGGRRTPNPPKETAQTSQASTPTANQEKSAIGQELNTLRLSLGWTNENVNEWFTNNAPRPVSWSALTLEEARTVLGRLREYIVQAAAPFTEGSQSLDVAPPIETTKDFPERPQEDQESIPGPKNEEEFHDWGIRAHGYKNIKAIWKALGVDNAVDLIAKYGHDWTQATIDLTAVAAKTGSSRD